MRRPFVLGARVAEADDESHKFAAAIETSKPAFSGALLSKSDRGLQKSQHDRESFVLVRARHAVPLLMKIRQRRELSTAEPTSTAK